MEQTLAPASRWALLVDPAAAQSVIERISKLRLPRRVCRPLDRRREQIENTELAKFDAEVEAAFEAEAEINQELAEIEQVRSDA
jgi:hypothetical protein